MSTTGFDIRYLAQLARLELTVEEQQAMGAQLDGVLAYMKKLNELEVGQVEPTAHAMPLVNVMRPDEVRPSLLADEALRNAPAQANGLFIVPKIVE